jgi:hypothetical protein
MKVRLREDQRRRTHLLEMAWGQGKEKVGELVVEVEMEQA